MYPLNKNLSFLVLFILLLAISFPRFNQRDIGPIKKFTGEPFDEFKAKGYYLLGDAPHYIELTKYFKGTVEQSSLYAPFAYRLLIPLICAVMPFDNILTSINILNIVCLCGSVVLLYKILALLGFPAGYSLLGCYMFVLSFGVFWYSSTGFIDPSFVFVLLLGLFFILKNNFTALLITILFGVLLKETSFILIPIYVVYRYYQKEKFAAGTILLFLAAFVPMLLVKILMNSVIPRSMIPQIDILISNLTSYKGFVTLALTLGIPGFLSFVYFIFVRRKIDLQANHNKIAAVMALYFSSIGLLILASFTAHLEGRLALPLFVSSIPFALLTIQYYRNLKYKSIGTE